MGGLLLLAIVSARGSSAVPAEPPDFSPEPVELLPAPTPTTTPTPSSEPAAHESGAAELVGLISLAIVTLLVLVGVVLLLLQGLQRRRTREKPWLGLPVNDDAGVNAVRERLREAAEQARGVLSTPTGGPAGDAVIAAWLTLEEAAEVEGAGRAPHQTSTEFTVALLGRYTTDEQALHQLLTLYQRARFGQADVVDAREVDAARSALDRVLRGLHDTPGALMSSPELLATATDATTDAMRSGEVDQA